MSSIGRASTLIAAGTIVSRLTGFVRSVVLVAAIGSVGRAADAFAVANQLPNNIYAIISTGLLTAVVVPQIVQAAVHPDGGRAFISKLFTLGTVALVVTTALATAAAPWLVQLYAASFSPDQLALATAFAYWCIPQLLFYGLYALLGEILNARKVYGPFTWAPIANNVVSIIGFGVFIALFGGPVTTVQAWTPTMIATLAGTATFGIVAQAIVLMLFWVRAGLHLKPDFAWRGIGLRNIGRLAGWTFLMIMAGQIAGVVQSRVMSAVSGDNPANTVAANAMLLFMLPYSVFVFSIGTAYFTQLSEHAAAGRHGEVRRDIARSIRILGLFIVLSTAVLAAAAVPASRIFTTSSTYATDAAWVLLAFLVSLLPQTVLFVIGRTFYAYNDTRTPFLFTLVQATVVIITALLAGQHLPAQFVTAGIALGQSIACIIQLAVAAWLLRRRLGTIGARSWMPALGVFIVAAIPAGLAGWLVYVLSGGAEGWMVSGQFLGAVGTGVIGLVALAVYTGILALLRVPELTTAWNTVSRLFTRR
ncbi:hypothetical protein GCM10009808_21330 [Microbacterium sediminicola]|uniref:Murein biosynthesis integral membrane protein MurJ n=1 Tax=Microbacterium sediminicola TaxID=415210 RepID=A0ABP4UIG0_9MICO